MLPSPASALLDFSRCESGAVTVEWVVLTAAIVGLGMVVLFPVANGTESMASKTAGYVDAVDVGMP